MARVLIGWEYGSGRGHLAVILPAAARLIRGGHEVTLALKDPAGSRAAWKPLGLTGLQAPFIPLPLEPDRSVATHTLADVFGVAGLIDGPRLAALVKAWRERLEAARPDVVVCEFSPTLALAALGSWPVVTIGTGYVCPPVGGPLPSIRFWEAQVPPASVAAEARFTEALAHARAANGLPPLERATDLFGGEAQVVCTFPEIDTYAERRADRAVGPPERGPREPPRPRTDRAFFYLARDAATPALMDAIAASGVPAHGYIRDADAATREALARPGIVIHAAPQPLGKLLPGCPLLIHHGGIGAAEAALASGTPQMLLPRHLEQQVNGMAVEKRLMTGKSVGAPAVGRDPDAAAAYIRRTAGSPVVRDRAAKLAAKLRGRNDPPAAEAVVRAVERCL